MKYHQLILLIVIVSQLAQLSQAQRLMCEFFPHLCVTEAPTISPSISPKPTSTPSDNPTITPSASPSPSTVPSETQTSKPTDAPSVQSSTQPSVAPTIEPTSTPSDNPTIFPSTSIKPTSTLTPTGIPSQFLSDQPSSMLSSSPSLNPSLNLSTAPSHHPSLHHSSIPSSIPSNHPSFSPTKTLSPSILPTSKPILSSNPSSLPSNEPSASTIPSTSPTLSPTKSIHPSLNPSDSPMEYPSLNPTLKPSIVPSINPSVQPTDSQSPSLNPTSEHSSIPSYIPSSLPTNNPSGGPSQLSSEQPSASTSVPSTNSPTFGPRPNLIMVLTDEHNLRTLGCYRQIFKNRKQDEQAYVWGDDIEVETPHIDRLASEGAIFTNFYTVAPLCTPSRASFMTGLYPQRTGASENHGRMKDDIVTFADILKKERGYHTGYGGKWHLNGEAKPGWSDVNDNDYRSFGFTDSTYLWNRGHWKFIDNDGNNRQAYEFWEKYNFVGREDEHFTTDFLFDRSIEFMKDAKSKNEPFAYVLSIPDPHGPNEVRQPYEDMYKNIHFSLPSTGKKAVRRNPATPGWNYNDHMNVALEDAENYLTEYENSNLYQNHLQQYFGMVKCIDDNVGKLLTFLTNEGLDDNTIVIFTSDHGDLLGEHGKMNKGRPFRTSAGVPFILRYPGKVLEGKKIHSALTSVDFAPTILTLMGVANHGGVSFDGTDFSNEVLGAFTSTNYPRTRFTFDTDKNPQWGAAIRRSLKLVVSKGDVPWLFDLDVDPYEVENFFDVPRYRYQRNSLLDDLKAAIDEFDIPLKDVPFIYWSTPSCFDSPDRIRIDSVNYTCEDLGGSLSMEQCATNQELRQHCSITCNACCQDSLGEMWVYGETLKCRQLQSNCNKSRVQKFCPLTCGQCSVI